MKHYTRKVVKHFYEITCPHCDATMKFEGEPYTIGNVWICERCFKYFTDDKIEEVKAPDRTKVKYVQYQRT